MCPFRLSSNKFLGFLGVLLLYAGAYGQHWQRETVTVDWDPTDPRRVYVHQIFYPERPVEDTLRFYHWLHSYTDIHSSLAGVLAGRYRLDFHFSSEKQRAYFRLDSLSEGAEWHREGDLVYIVPGRPLHKLEIFYTVRWPLRKFTGIGYDKATGYDLREWLLQPVGRMGGRSLAYQNMDLSDRPAVRIPVQIIFNHPPSGVYWQSTAKVDSTGGQWIFTDTTTRIYLAGRYRPFKIYRSGNRQWIVGPEIWQQYSVLEWATAIDRIESALPARLLPSKILVTSTDLRRFPVYDIEGLPVIKPFPRDFSFQVSLFYQTVRQALGRLPRDYRRHYGFWSGLEQWYVMRFVDKYFPEMRMTGAPVQWPVVRSYRLFQVPYKYKYYYSYRYIAGMNYDQALRLPADSLSNFNLRIGTPSKSALGWDFLNAYAGNRSLESVLEDFYSLGPGLTPVRFDSIWHAHQLPSIDFMWDDFYRTARKIDFKWKNLRHAGGDSLRIVNKTGVRFPVYVEGIERPLLFNGRDTTIARVPGARPLRMNTPLLYPELYKYDNTVPRWKKPLRIRFWQDMEAPFSRQLFINPDLNYNLYDGWLLGLGINNKTFLDKPFTWQVRPFYGTRSHMLTGQAQFRYIRRVVKPYRFGWSMGGYVKTFHYDFDKLYRSGALYATLSFKDRRARFMKGQDWNVEWLHVDKQTDHPDETSRYDIALLRHRWQLRGLLKRYRLESEIQWHKQFVKIQADFRWRAFIDKYRQWEWRLFAGWMPYNRTTTDYFSFSLSRPVDYLFKYHYYGRSETSGLFAQQYIYADGAFKVFYPESSADRWMLVNNMYIGLYKRFNWFVDFGWMASRGRTPVFHYDTGLRVYLVPDYFELYFPVYSDLGPIPFDRNYWQYIRVMFVLDLPGLFKMFSRSWY